MGSRQRVDDNDKPRPFLWTKTADDPLGSIARFAHRTLATHPAWLISGLP
jgi:hypothetical protein